jgi:hypothetical protein
MDNNESYNCYYDTVRSKAWSSFDCDMADVTKLLNIDTFSYDMKELIGINLQNKHIVVDNSPLPVGGADS